MTTILKEVHLSEEVCLYLQRLTYEIECYKSVLQTVITTTGKFAYNKKIYDHHMKKYQTVYAEQKLVFSELISEYGSEYSMRKDVHVNVDFDMCKLQFITEGGHTSCQHKGH